MSRRRVHILELVLLAIMFAGCASPREYFYTLTSNAATGTSGVFTKASPSIAVGPVSVPEAVDRPQIVVRTGANQLTIAEQQRWAASLESQIARVIAENLTLLFDTSPIASYEQNMGPRADIQVLVDVQRFEATLGQAVTIESLWTIRRPSREPTTGRSVARESIGGDGYDALVAAHSRALATLSREIGEAIRVTNTASR